MINHKDFEARFWLLLVCVCVYVCEHICRERDKMTYTFLMKDELKFIWIHDINTAFHNLFNS